MARTSRIKMSTNQHGRAFPIIPGTYTCHTCKNKGTCTPEDFDECNYHEPCPGCLFRDTCYDKRMYYAKGEEGRRFWTELSERIAGCMKSERFEIEGGFFNWSPADETYCHACSLWHPTGKYCTRHAEPCAGRSDY